MLSMPFQAIDGATAAIPALALAGNADTLLGPEIQRAIIARYIHGKLAEFDCGHEFLIEMPVAAAAAVEQFAETLMSR